MRENHSGQEDIILAAGNRNGSRGAAEKGWDRLTMMGGG
jgi:hypothetical protein